MRKLLSELAGYGAVSGVALALDIATLEVLVKVAGWHYVPAAVAAFFAGGVLAYHLSVRYVFTGRQLANRSLEFGSFVALGVVGVVVNVAILGLTVGQLGLDLLPAKLLAAGGTFTTNFVLRRQLLFAPARIAE